MRCALCLQESQLQRSHVIPEFLYRSLYDDKHRLQVLSTLEDRDNSLEQKGLRESLLCTNCEQKISVWERYASLVLQGGVPLTVRREGKIVFVSGVDYLKFRLFQLSILWRASVSTLPFFKRVNLGPHEEVLRQWLDTEQGGDPERYGCLMFGINLNGSAFTQVIMQPVASRVDSTRSYRFMFGGFLWAYLVSSRSLGAVFSACTLRPEGCLLFMVQPAQSMQDLASFSKELTRLGRSPS
jgi:hypothetical protein